MLRAMSNDAICCTQCFLSDNLLYDYIAGSKTAYFAKQYKIEDGTLRVYGHVKNGFDKGNRLVVSYNSPLILRSYIQ